MNPNTVGEPTEEVTSMDTSITRSEFLQVLHRVVDALGTAVWDAVVEGETRIFIVANKMVDHGVFLSCRADACLSSNSIFSHPGPKTKKRECVFPDFGPRKNPCNNGCLFFCEVI